jgi:hypothetical protein
VEVACGPFANFILRSDETRYLSYSIIGRSFPVSLPRPRGHLLAGAHFVAWKMSTFRSRPKAVSTAKTTEELRGQAGLPGPIYSRATPLGAHCKHRIVREQTPHSRRYEARTASATCELPNLSLSLPPPLPLSRPPSRSSRPWPDAYLEWDCSSVMLSPASSLPTSSASPVPGRPIACSSSLPLTAARSTRRGKKSAS